MSHSIQDGFINVTEPANSDTSHTLTSLQPNTTYIWIEVEAVRKETEQTDRGQRLPLYEVLKSNVKATPEGKKPLIGKRRWRGWEGVAIGYLNLPAHWHNEFESSGVQSICHFTLESFKLISMSFQLQSAFNSFLTFNSGACMSSCRSFCVFLCDSTIFGWSQISRNVSQILVNILMHIMLLQLELQHTFIKHWHPRPLRRSNCVWKSCVICHCNCYIA